LRTFVFKNYLLRQPEANGCWQTALSAMVFVNSGRPTKPKTFTAPSFDIAWFKGYIHIASSRSFSFRTVLKVKPIKRCSPLAEKGRLKPCSLATVDSLSATRFLVVEFYSYLGTGSLKVRAVHGIFMFQSFFWIRSLFSDSFF
jgi:hypothetical protein